MAFLSLPVRSLFSILANLDIADVYALRRTAVGCKALVDNYMAIAFDVNQRLGSFFDKADDVSGFREVLKEGGGLVTGSFMTHLFGRRAHTSRKLVVNVCAGDAVDLIEFMLRKGYRYVPRMWSQQSWLEVLKDANAWEVCTEPENLVPTVGLLRFYNGRGYCVQLELARRCPFDAILASQSTLLLNAFDGDKAFSLYPHMSFVSKANTVLNMSMGVSKNLLSYYREGWVDTNDLRTVQTLDGALRFVGDSDTWVIDFSRDNRQGSLRGDYLAANSWTLVSGWGKGEFVVDYSAFGSSRMHSDYCVVDYEEAVNVYSAVLDVHYGDKCYDSLFAEAIGRVYKEKREGNARFGVGMTEDATEAR
ncbi:hypothetical protein C8J56DRAFT_1040747 [Mycena floridula]|nr:hypothetical protein C8J56DRAFT_1040747 [Mycena floridula]